MRKVTTFLVALCATTALWAGTSNFTPAAFTIAEGKQVYFSQGNLQCSGVTTKNYVWSFAENQYDMLGAANVSGGALADKIDLFGWSTDTEATQWGISTSISKPDYKGNIVDWGTNEIGDNAANTYRTLTESEWGYLFNFRTNATNLRGLARIKLNSDGTEYANGLIFLPDNWTAPEGITFAGNNTTYTNNTFTLDQWQQLETNGAIFLPASGIRKGTNMSDIQNIGYYWSATVYNDDYSYFLKFSSTEWYVGTFGAVCNGYAVRLVQDLYAITITTPENGTVTADMTTAAAGETVTLTVTPAIDYELGTLSVKDADNNTITVTNNTFTMPASAVTVTATFKKIDYAINIASDIENGKVSVTSGATTANYGDEVELTITPATGYELDVLTVKDADNNDVTVSEDNKFTMPASAVTVSATFKKIDYAITISSDIENGKVSVTSGATTANYGDEIELTITPATGYELDKLTVKDADNGDVTVSEDYKFEMPASAVTVTATFKKIDYAITIASDIENGKVSVASGATTANYGDEVELTITPATGYELDVLSVKDADNNDVTVSADYKFAMPASAVTVTATFKKIDYTITIATDIENGKVSVASGSTTANYGDEVELTITPATGYELDVLLVKDADNNDVTVSEDNKFIMPASEVTISATFKKIDYTITIASDIENGKVSVTSGATTANYGDEVELTITPATGYELDVLTVKDADNQEIAVENYKFTMPASAVTVSATFKLKTPTALENAEMVEIYAAAGRIYGADGMQIFTLTGQNVTEMNGQLNGVYIVKIGDKAQKVLVSRK